MIHNFQYCLVWLIAVINQHDPNHFNGYYERLYKNNILMKKKNNYTDTNLSFDDFERTMMSQGSEYVAVDELVRERLSLEKEARNKERELKKAKRLKRV